MIGFRISILSNSSVYSVFRIRDRVYLDAEYQREADIWTLEKRQLLIDSILNGYDIPKIYLHEFYPPKKIRGKEYDYAVIDGKQRLKTIWDFINGAFPLSPDFTLFRDPALKLHDLTYNELKAKHEDVVAEFHGKNLSIVTIITEELDFIEDMFTRLNEAVPLNAAEKRNAFGGLIPQLIRTQVKHEFFTKKTRVSPKRYRHHDITAKMLYLVSRGEIVDTKKVYLDAFVREFPKAAQGQRDAKALAAAVNVTLSDMSKVFVDKDDLLSSQGTITLYFWLFYAARQQSKLTQLNRKKFIAFNTDKANNRLLAEENISKADFSLLEFDRLNQTPNDAYAIEYRIKVLIDKLKLGIKVSTIRS